MSNTIYDVDFLRSLPDVLKNDETMRALAEAIAGELQKVSNEISKTIIYARIDELPEEVLDVLAYDFKVDWWDYDFTIEEKRATLKSSWDVHRKLGTPFAVETALSAIYPGTTVREWFEYGGNPYHFRILIPVDQTQLDINKHTKVLSLIAYYKNLRSVLDEVEYYGTSGAAIAYTSAAFVGCDVVITATAYSY